MSQPAQPLITLRNLTKVYGKGDKAQFDWNRV